MIAMSRPSYIPAYSNRKKFCRKIRGIEKRIHQLKNENKWIEASRLEWVLRNAWWGYKRYFNLSNKEVTKL
mgnify:CR=1 FL=1